MRTVYLALADGASKVDRSALLLDIWDRLQPAKFNVQIVGRRNSSSTAPASTAPETSTQNPVPQNPVPQIPGPATASPTAS